MMTLCNVLLVMCIALCVPGNVLSGKKTKRLLSQILDELQSLKDADIAQAAEISTLQAADKNKTAEISTLQDADIAQAAEISTLQAADKNKTGEISTLQDTVAKHEERIRQMEDECNNKTAELNNQITDLKDTAERNEEEIRQVEDQIANLQPAANSAAFMAVMNGVHHPNRREVIPFQHTQLNVGQHYNATTSVFTCPESGLYLFSVSLFSGDINENSDYSQVNGVLKVDGVTVAQIFSATNDPDHDQFHQAAVTAVVKCPKVGKVWVEGLYFRSQVHGFSNLPTSLFTGYAITLYNTDSS